MEYRDGTIYIGIDQKNTKCYVYLEKEKSPSEKMLAKLESVKEEKFTVEEMPTIKNVDTSTSTNKLYTAEDDHGTSYVFRGNVTDNWLRFANKTWRIIRINGDGTLRVIYQCGTNSCTDKTGDATQLTTSAYNSSYNDNTYVGFYNKGSASTSYENAHNNSNPSTIAAYLNNWYNDNLKNYETKLSGETGWCNDREKAKVERNNYGTLGYGTNATLYAAVDRFYDASWSKLNNPTLKCTNLTRDLFTTNTTSLPTENKGNKKLAAPIGLITADEVAMAGGYPGTNNTSYYLYTNKYYWTMSPYNFNNGNAAVFYVYSDGWLGNAQVKNSSDGVRPVINLKTDITITGKGTESSPFVVGT